MRSRTITLIYASAAASFCASPAGAQEMILSCPHPAYCAAVAHNGDFYSGSPGLDGGDRFRKRANIFDGKYPTQDLAGVKITAFQCGVPGEWCIGLDNKGGVYTGSARDTGVQFFQKRN